MPEKVEAKSRPQSDEAKSDRERVRKFLDVALKRFKISSEAEAEIRRNSLDDFRFRVGEQWPLEIQQSRNIDGRPCLTMNRLPKFIKQVTNEQRQQRPSIQVNPVGDGADIEKAEVIQGMIRHIEVQADAEIAYDTAFDHMVTGGFGWWRVFSEYLDDDSGNQELRVGPILNPFTVYCDPSAQKADRSDGRFLFVVEDIDREAYKIDYPDSEAASLDNFSSVGDSAATWSTKDTIRVAEYWYVEESMVPMAELSDGSKAPMDMVLHDDAGNPKLQDEQGNALPTIQRKWNRKQRKVKFAKINAIEILEERDWPGKWIPLIPVIGDDIIVDGKRHISGLVRHAKDPQRMYNYWNSAATEAVALAPKAPYVAAAGQIEDYEEMWKQANTRNLSVLPYKPVDIAGTAVPPPQRNAVEPPIQAMVLMIRQADNDLKAITGIYDASLGQAGPDQSGKAILARQKQSDVANMDYTDNLSRAMRHTGRVLIDLIPHFYDAPRMQRIIKPDQTVRQVGVFNSKVSGVGTPEEALQAIQPQTPNPQALQNIAGQPQPQLSQ